MATFLTLVNNVLTELNEPTLATSTDLTSATATVGIQTSVKENVNKSIRDISTSEVEWSYLYSSGSQALTAGIQEYNAPSDASTVDWDSFILIPTELTTNGEFTSNITNWTASNSGTGSATYASGALSLAAGTGTSAVYQELSLTRGRTYMVSFAMKNAATSGTAVNPTIAVSIGTSALATDISTGTYTSAGGSNDEGDLSYHNFTFEASATSHFITIKNETASSTVLIDNVSVKEDFHPRQLRYLNEDEWKDRIVGTDKDQNPDHFAEPKFVYRTVASSTVLTFGVSPVPDKSSYTVEFDYYTSPTDLSASSDTPSIPTRYHDLIVKRAVYYTLLTRADPQLAQVYLQEYSFGLQRMRTDLINRKNYMFAV
tara:strand:- start:134 stop:1249 length:1116 start_codon:yes stop_codon:yes gene_type:complete